MNTFILSPGTVPGRAAPAGGWRRRRFMRSAGAAALLGCAVPALAQDEPPVVLGQSAPFTGPAAQLGIQYHEGARLWLDTHNAQPGRRPVRLELMDDGHDAARCAQNTQALAARQVFALFGYVGLACAQAALPLAAQAQLPFIAPLSGARALREPLRPHTFHLRASFDDEAALIVRQLTQLGQRQIGVFHQDDGDGQAGLEAVARALAPLELQPVATAAVAATAADAATVGPAVEAILAARPEAVVLAGTHAASAAFIRAVRRAGFVGGLYNLSTVGTQALADTLGKEAAGVVVSQVVPSPFNNANPIVREFNESLKANGGGARLNHLSLEGYLAARLVTEGLRKAGPRATREAFVVGLESLQRQNFGGFAVSLSPREHVASRFVELSMLTANGRVRT